MILTRIGGMLLVAVGLWGCSGDSSTMTGPAPFPGSSQGTVHGQGLSVSGAAVLVRGVPVQGRVTQGTGDPALFRVRVAAPEGPATIARVVMEYSQPGPNHHGGPMMGAYAGTVLCYDDGTHGDDVPGDGIYHYMDPDDQIGCHGLNAPIGEYHYSFWAVHVNGQRSNTVSVVILRQ